MWSSAGVPAAGGLGEWVWCRRPWNSPRGRRWVWDRQSNGASSIFTGPAPWQGEREGGEREGGTERRGGERGMEVRGIRRWDEEGGTKRETDFDLFPYLAGPVSDVQLLDCSPEQCSNPGWPLHPLFQPLSPLPPPKPMQHSWQQFLGNKSIPSPAIQGANFTLSLSLTFSLPTLPSLALPSSYNISP